jgi:hypothetical protein
LVQSVYWSERSVIPVRGCHRTLRRASFCRRPLMPKAARSASYSRRRTRKRLDCSASVQSAFSPNRHETVSARLGHVLAAELVHTVGSSAAHPKCGTLLRSMSASSASSIWRSLMRDMPPARQA